MTGRKRRGDERHATILPPKSIMSYGYCLEKKAALDEKQTHTAGVGFEESRTPRMLA